MINLFSKLSLALSPIIRNQRTIKVYGSRFCFSNINDKNSEKKDDPIQKEPVQISKQNQMNLQFLQQSQQSVRDQIEQKMLARLYQLEQAHKKKQQLIDQELKFPIKLCGTKDKYQKRYAYLPERIMGYYRIPKSSINKYLLNMYKASLYAMADSNTKYMDQYWQAGLKQAVLECIDQAKKNNYQIKVEDNNYVQNIQIQQSCEILDSIMFRGLSMDRDQNQNPKQYIKFSEADEVGLITYTPKRVTGNNQNFIDPNKNKNVYQGYEKMILRVLVRIKSPLKINIKQFQIPNDIYTWEHVVIFENQMVAPKHLQSAYKLQTLMEWLGKYRFGQWRIVDIDNFLKGNSPFRKHYPAEEEIDPVFKGTKLDKSHYVDIRMI